MLLHVVTWFFVVDFLLYNHYENYIALTGYSDVSIENGYYGRLYVTHYEHGYSKSEVCTSGFNRYEGETLCQAHGYSYNSYTAYAIYQNHTFQTNLYNNALNLSWFFFIFFFLYSVSPRYSHNTVSAHCSSYRYGSSPFCDIRILGYCSQVVYIQCYGNFLRFP